MNRNQQTILDRGWQTSINITMRKMHKAHHYWWNQKISCYCPEYICYCCNQLWYKQSVITAENLRLSNLTAEKYWFTMVTATGLLEGSERAQIYRIALAKEVYLWVYSERHFGELAYPGILPGPKRLENDDWQVNVHYSDICRSKSSTFHQIG